MVSVSLQTKEDRIAPITATNATLIAVTNKPTVWSVSMIQLLYSSLRRLTLGSSFFIRTIELRQETDGKSTR